MHVIDVKRLYKKFRVYEKSPGFWGSVTSLFSRKFSDFTAVSDVSFTIRQGELVGFIGPNGAGKTTTLKMLAGLIYPTSGTLSVSGFTPYERKNEFLKSISLVMGQKNQLWWDLPPVESFLLNKEIYGVSDKQYRETLAELVDLMDIQDILRVQVRNLSLGQRMKCELIAQLLHRPRILFLDEPTIGLDVIMQKKLREFIREYNRRYNATVILTSHYMDDVKELCQRVIVIDRGTLLYDGSLEEVIRKYSLSKLLSVVFEKVPDVKEIEKLGKVVESRDSELRIQVDRKHSNTVAGHILKTYKVADLNIEEPPIEDIIRSLFSNKT